LGTSLVRILVVDDYEPLRRFVCSTLANISEFQVIGEASDGLEAVRKAEELQPDLIVLDIGLPILNGLDAARRIREASPESKILFLSQESSADVVHEALSLGALGYVLKIHAGTELLDAVEAARHGRQFVSSGLSGQNFTDKEDSQAHYRQTHSEALTSLAPGKGKSTRCHEVQFNSDDASFLVGITRFIEVALEAGKAVLVVATESHRKSFLQRLQAHGVDVATAIEEGRYNALDAAEALSTFMVPST
jgi:DNA-binding NarL/FixJ family response regulator